MVDLSQFGLKKNNLYEVLATTWQKDAENDEVIPNTACMGIRMMDRQHISIGPYSTTKTYKNLKENGWVVLNLINNMKLFAFGALKHPDAKHPELREFPRKFYDYYSQKNKKFQKLKDISQEIPFIAKSWGILLGKVITQESSLKKDELGEKKITSFKVEINFCNKLRKCYDLINRAENLALETIIIATRMKVAVEEQNATKLQTLKKKALDHINKIERFGENKDALQAIEYVKDYLACFNITF
ncbi:MAG: DUF447 family protein [Promethearchaeia archaeon]